MTHFLISYNKADKAWAEWIAWQLEEAKYTTVLQAWDFTPGANFVLKMHEAAKDAERTIALLSPDYLTSIFTAPEWAAAFAQDPTGEKGLLIPICVRKCDPEGLLGQIVFQDIAGLAEAAAKVAVLAAVRRGRAKPATKPEFPPTAGRSVVSRPRFPGALPPIWNVPHRRNPNFTGREELLALLRASLTSGKYAALTQALHGLGGVGKTQTATEYAYRYVDEYDAVLWVPAEDPTALAGHFAALASEIGLEVDPADQPAAISAVHRWLRENSRWLLIFDNAEAAAGIQSYLPHVGNGHVIITSRNPEWRKVAKTLAVQRFAPDEANAFLLTRSGRNVEDEDESTSAAALAEELGGLALALEQAAAYVEAHGLSHAEYLRLFQEHRERVLSREASPDYPHTVESVWTISLQAIERDSPAAAELLSLLAFFAPEDIPLSLIRAGADYFPDLLAAAVCDELSFRGAIRILRRHSLVEVDREGVSVHRVVQAVTRNSLSDDEREAWAEAAILSICFALPKDPGDVLGWPTLARLVSHISVAAQHCENAGAGYENAGFCLNHMGSYHYRRADYASARTYLERSIHIAEAAFGADHPNVASCITNLGLLELETGDVANALASHRRALQIDEAALGLDDPAVARDLNNLAAVLCETGALIEAKDYVMRAVRIDEAAFGTEHPEVATNLTVLGGIQTKLGDITGAEANLARALRIVESALGPEHQNLAPILSSLGRSLLERGDLRGAQESLRRALRICTDSFGLDHPSVARELSNLGIVQQLLGDLAEAQKNFQRALAIVLKVFGKDHAITLHVQHKLTELGKQLQQKSGSSSPSHKIPRRKKPERS